MKMFLMFLLGVAVAVGCYFSYIFLCLVAGYLVAAIRYEDMRFNITADELTTLHKITSDLRNQIWGLKKELDSVKSELEDERP